MKDLTASLRFRVGQSRESGFTLVELSAVVLIISVLVALLCSALNHTKAKALRISCVDNLRQLQLGWLMYLDDSNDELPLNQTAPAPVHHRIVPRYSSTNSWVVGSPLDDTTGKGIVQGSLYPYVLSKSVYRCPMDNSKVKGHPTIPRTRSYSMNMFLGGDNAGEDSRVKTHYSQLLFPGKNEVFVFIEEHQESIWLSSFVVPSRDRMLVSANSWISTPADRHTQGANLTFADGHVEYWKWYSPISPSNTNRLASTGRQLSDLRRVQDALPQ